MKLRQTHPIEVAAENADISRATGYRITLDPRLPSQKAQPRERCRPDPLEEIFDAEVVPFLKETPLFCPISACDRPLPSRWALDALRTILRHRLVLARLPVGFATPHGLRAGFLIQAALDGAPLVVAMKLSLQRSAVQARKYYSDVEISESPATNLLGE